MAFGFFKKQETADILFTNGTIYTMDPDQPNAQAIACKDGRILALGDRQQLNSLVSNRTEIIDLQGQTMLPGFVKLNSALAQEAFLPTCIPLSQLPGPQQALTFDKEIEAAKASAKEKAAAKESASDDREFLCENAATLLSRVPFLAKIAFYLQTQPVAQEPEQQSESHAPQGLFFYGGCRAQLAGCSRKEIRAALDLICPDRPLLILLEEGSLCLLNTRGANAVQTAAEEDSVTHLSIDYIVSVIAAPDFEAYQQTVAAQGAALAQKGYTTVFDCLSRDYPQSLYRSCLQELLLEEQLTQRYFAAYFLREPEETALLLHKLRQRQTDCTELQDMIRCDALHIDIGPASTASSAGVAGTPGALGVSDVSETAAQVLTISESHLQELCVHAADIGCNLMLTASGQDAAQACAQALCGVRNQGYKKNAAIFAYSSVASEDDIREQLPTDECFLEKHLLPESANSTAQAIDRLTVDAAEALRMSHLLGSLQKGKAADFTVLPCDPHQQSLSEFLQTPASFTVVAGKLIR